MSLFKRSENKQQDMKKEGQASYSSYDSLYV